VSVRRVVTGHDPSGKSVFTADEEIDAVTVGLFPGWEFFALWGADAAPHFPDDGGEPPWSTYFPPVGGLRFSFSTIPPAGLEVDPDLDIPAAEAEVERALPGMAAHIESAEADAGMHTTATIDFEVVLRGEVILELDDGAERRLKPGDTVVQNGTRHRWRNPGTEPVLLAVFMLGVPHAARPPV
jgi:mannose-6-phosphate isomerase-like protein (cupin superfamily)